MIAPALEEAVKPPGSASVTTDSAPVDAISRHFAQGTEKPAVSFHPDPKPWYPDDVITIEQLAGRLQLNSTSTVARMDLPTVYCGRGRHARYIWGQVLEVLRERAK